MKVAVKVRLKKSILDPQGKAVFQALQSLGFSEIQEVRIGKLIELEIAEGKNAEEIRWQVEEASRKLLSNPVMEDFEIEYIEAVS
jgi:phosphoribosylformylglycinamidine synthase